MVCYLVFKNLVAMLTGVSEEEAIEILESIKDEVGHDKNAVKAIIDLEQSNMIYRLKKKKEKKKKEEEEKSMAYV
jgi:hypothetical protein